MLGQSDPRLVLLLETEGVRNLIEFHTYHGRFPMPSRASFALYQHLEGGEATGAAELVGTWQYDDAAQAERAREELEYSRGRWILMIEQQTGGRGLAGMLGSLGASLLGIDVPAVRGAIDALRVSTEGSRVILRAELTSGQVRALLNLAAMGGSAAR
jgi:hypothetical protein